MALIGPAIMTILDDRYQGDERVERAAKVGGHLYKFILKVVMTTLIYVKCRQEPWFPKEFGGEGIIDNWWRDLPPW